MIYVVSLILSYTEGCETHQVNAFSAESDAKTYVSCWNQIVGESKSAYDLWEVAQVKEDATHPWPHDAYSKFEAAKMAYHDEMWDKMYEEHQKHQKGSYEDYEECSNRLDAMVAQWEEDHKDEHPNVITERHRQEYIARRDAMPEWKAYNLSFEPLEREFPGCKSYIPHDISFKISTIPLDGK